MLLVVMREASQQQTSMGIQCSNSVYKNLHMALQAARDTMDSELQAMQTKGLEPQVFGNHTEPGSVSGGDSLLSNGMVSKETMQTYGVQSDRALPEGRCNKRPAGNVCQDSQKRTRLLNMAHQAEQ
jgi:hypothetical protein